jgi:hypothetical protein
MLGAWDDMMDDFITLGGGDGIFEMSEGQIIRKD